MKKAITEVVYGIGGIGGQRAIAIIRGDRVRQYYNVSTPSAFRLAAAIRECAYKGKATVYPAPSGWLAVLDLESGGGTGG